MQLLTRYLISTNWRVCKSDMEERSIKTSTQLNVYFPFQSFVLHTANESIPNGKEKYMRQEKKSENKQTMTPA